MPYSKLGYKLVFNMANGKLAFVHSPFTSAEVWAPVASLLREKSVLVDFSSALKHRAPFYPAISRIIAEQTNSATKAPVLLIAHSGAGALIAAAANRMGPRFKGAIFVDALLPHPAKSWLETLPSPLRAKLDGLVQDGMLPCWHRWLPTGALEMLLPDVRVRNAFVRSLPSVPLAFGEEIGPAANLPPDRTYGYLQLSDSYEQEAKGAKASGWRVARLELHHLALLTHPRVIAEKLEEMAQC